MKKIFKPIAVFLMLSILSSFIIQDTPQGLTKGEIAPDFEVKDLSGATFKLKEKLKSGPVVMVFYRGQWCPYCNKYLGQLEDSLSLIKAKGASVVAISPETYEGVAKTIEKTKASFPVIYDAGLKISNAYKVNYTVDAEAKKMYTGYGIDFEKANGANGANLPVPATYVIGKDGKIKFAFFNPDFKKRAPVKDILDNL